MKNNKRDENNRWKKLAFITTCQEIQNQQHVVRAGYCCYMVIKNRV